MLRIDSFAFAPGIYWLQGANGTGKSTLLQAIAGVASFTGDIVLAGQPSVSRWAWRCWPVSACCNWLVPVLLPPFLLLLAVGGAAYYTHLLNAVVSQPTKAAGLSNWPKPLLSLFLYKVLANKRLTLLLTKAALAAGGLLYRYQ